MMTMTTTTATTDDDDVHSHCHYHHLVVLLSYWRNRLVCCDVVVVVNVPFLSLFAFSLFPSWSCGPQHYPWEQPHRFHLLRLSLPAAVRPIEWRARTRMVPQDNGRGELPTNWPADQTRGLRCCDGSGKIRRMGRKVQVGVFTRWGKLVILPGSRRGQGGQRIITRFFVYQIALAPSFSFFGSFVHIARLIFGLLNLVGCLWVNLRLELTSISPLRHLSEFQQFSFSYYFQLKSTLSEPCFCRYYWVWFFVWPISFFRLFGCFLLQIFQGNVGPGQVVSHNLKTHTAAKLVRIYPVENQRWPAMRVEIYVTK